MGKRVLAALAVLIVLVLGVGCSDAAIGTYSSYWDKMEVTSYEGEAGYPEGYRWISGTANMAETGEITVCYLTLAEAGEAELACSLALKQTKGKATLYWEDPEGERILLHDTSGTSDGRGTYTLQKGTGRFLVRADRGNYEVGIGLSGFPEDDILYLGLTDPGKEG